MSTNRNTNGPLPEGDEFDWRWVGEPESWMGLRSERAMTQRPASVAGASDPQAGRIEASQASFWFGFVDDIVIRVGAAGAGSRVDMRSLSRQGRGDLGVNAKRIRAYMAALKQAAG